MFQANFFVDLKKFKKIKKILKKVLQLYLQPWYIKWAPWLAALKSAEEVLKRLKRCPC